MTGAQPIRRDSRSLMRPSVYARTGSSERVCGQSRISCAVSCGPLSPRDSRASHRFRLSGSQSLCWSQISDALEVSGGLLSPLGTKSGRRVQVSFAKPFFAVLRSVCGPNPWRVPACAGRFGAARPSVQTGARLMSIRRRGGSCGPWEASTQERRKTPLCGTRGFRGLAPEL
jgi:hypothetical protein